MKVAFVGLGVMGYPMAGFLARAGNEVTVFNRTTAKAEAWELEYGGFVADSPERSAHGAEIVFCCVGNDDDVRQVILEPEEPEKPKDQRAPSDRSSCLPMVGNRE